MNTYNKINEMVERLRSTTSRNEKEAILKEYNNDYILDFLYCVYCPYIDYGVRDISDTRLAKAKSNDNYTDYIDLLDKLDSRELSGNAALGAIKHFKETHSADEIAVLEMCINRTIGAGVSITTINKVHNDYIPVFTVMLAQQLDIENLNKDKLYVIEEKMDGVRFEAITNADKCILYTRNGNIAHIPSIENELSTLCAVKPETLVLSLEITGKDRKSVSGTINKFLKGTATKEDEQDLVANVFDVNYAADFEKQVCNMRLYARRMILDVLFEDFESDIVRRVDSVTCVLGDDVQEVVRNYYKEIVDAGGEGVIVKDLDGFYEFKRSKNWLKAKEWLTMDLRIVGFTEGYGKRENTIGGLICETDDKRISVNVGSGLSDEDLEYIANNKEQVLGKIVEVKYNAEIDDKNTGKRSLFLPVYVDIRTDKDETD